MILEECDDSLKGELVENQSLSNHEQEENSLQKENEDIYENKHHESNR